ncbi:MAG: hypothetical protein J0M01_07675 [Dechloromonas sp.]|jgi:hypothetical protein|nr:hypothetical protein [Dechloromonas sp.]
MSLANVSESDALDVFLKGVDPSWRAGATGYLALVTGVSVDEADPLANECTYTGYARVAQTKATAWSGSGATRTNANLIQWGKRTDGGATQTATHVIWCDTASGAVGMALVIPLDDDLPISLNIRPQIEASGLTVNAE